MPNTQWFSRHVRRIHMDFHTLEVEPETVIKNFDVKAYVKTLRDAHVNSLVSFCKCHHGNSYYNTKIGHKHAGLPADLDMFGEILEECHRHNIKVVAYYSIGWITSVEKNHPDWMEQPGPDVPFTWENRPKKDFWNHICLNSPYLKEMVLPELTEITENYDIDGLWLDILFNEPCFCPHCRKKYEQLHNKPYPADTSELHDFVIQSRGDFVNACRERVQSINPDVMVSYNYAGTVSSLVPMVDYCTIETHPGGIGREGAWTEALITYKMLQALEKPWESCTDRFLHGWGGWDDQTLENIRASTSRILAHGGVINLGDQTYPSGQLDAEIYKKIGENYSFIEQREKWTIQPEKVPHIAIMAEEINRKHPNIRGAAQCLAKHHWHFDLLYGMHCDQLANYKAIILPNIGKTTLEMETALRNYVNAGGCLLVTGNTSLDSEKFALSDLFGIKYQDQSPFSHGYLQIRPEISAGIRKSPLCTYGRFYEIESSADVQVLADHIYPLIEAKADELFYFRHEKLSPPGQKSRFPGIIMNQYGKGRVIYAAAPLLEIYWQENQWYLGDVAHNLLNLLVPEPLFKLEAPKSVELNVTRKDGHLVFHLINYHPAKESDMVEEMYPVYDVSLKVRKELVQTNVAELIPEKTAIQGTLENDYLILTIPKIDVYTLIVIK